LHAAGVLLAVAGERRALRDVQRFMSPCTTATVMHGDMNAGIEVVSSVEGRLARGAELFPDGIPASWLGVDFDAHRLVVGPASRLSLAVRWHGQNAAILWEIEGDPVTLSTSVATGGWTSNAPCGETLWLLESGAAGQLVADELLSDDERL